MFRADFWLAGGFICLAGGFIRLAGGFVCLAGGFVCSIGARTCSPGGNPSVFAEILAPDQPAKPRREQG
jgi:hypothetical protein